MELRVSKRRFVVSIHNATLNILPIPCVYVYCFVQLTVCFVVLRQQYEIVVHAFASSFFVQRCEHLSALYHGVWFGPTTYTQRKNDMHVHSISNH